MSRHIPEAQLYRRYDRFLRYLSFKGFVDRLQVRADAGDPEARLRCERYRQLRAEGWPLEDAFRYAEREAWQRLSDARCTSEEDQ